MPFYRYQCETCGAEFKKLYMNGNTASVLCPECKSRATYRLLPRIGVVYKGKGYYTTDYERSSGVSGEKGSSSSGAED